MLGISFLNSIVARIDRENINAAEVLTKLRYRIIESLTRGTVNNEDIHDGMDIAVCIFDTKNSKLSYAGAYRPLWIVNNGQLTEYRPDKIPIAVDKDRNSAFTNNEIQLQQGDRVYLFTDGITDQFGERENGKHSKLKPKRLRELLCRIHDFTPERQMHELESMIDQWRGDCEQTDDITFIGVLEA
jgi:serine phosphatase RsbU (regulator of sigma subunit)